MLLLKSLFDGVKFPDPATLGMAVLDDLLAQFGKNRAYLIAELKNAYPSAYPSKLNQCADRTYAVGLLSDVVAYIKCLELAKQLKREEYRNTPAVKFIQSRLVAEWATVSFDRRGV